MRDEAARGERQAAEDRLKTRGPGSRRAPRRLRESFALFPRGRSGSDCGVPELPGTLGPTRFDTRTKEHRGFRELDRVSADGLQHFVCSRRRATARHHPLDVGTRSRATSCPRNSPPLRGLLAWRHRNGRPGEFPKHSSHARYRTRVARNVWLVIEDHVHPRATDGQDFATPGQEPERHPSHNSLSERVREGFR
jgi:hypothetical protein